MSDNTSEVGRQLYRLLPAVYRNRDAAGDGERPGDLQQYLDACGELLDRVYHTLLQRLADSFPEGYTTIGDPQSWLLPYLADLFDAQLLSPTPQGRSAEVANAVPWRQRKGTLACIEQIAQAVAGVEVEVQEGWRRVARTPRVDTPLLPPAAFGDDREYNRSNPLDAARQPGLPVTTVDFRRSSRAVAEPDPVHPLAKTSNFAGQSVTWRQIHPTGVPCFPGSYEDVSLRTVDLRSPDYQRGHTHPHQLILFAPPPLGFFRPGWQEQQATQPDDVVIDEETLFEDEVFAGSITVNAGRLTLRRCIALGDIFINTNDTQPALSAEDCLMDQNLTVSAGRSVLIRCAVRHLQVSTADNNVQPELTANSCLFDQVTGSDETPERIRLEYCTVLGDLFCYRVEASDCIFAGLVGLAGDDAGTPSCIRYSSLPPDLEEGKPCLSVHANTTDKPVFLHLPMCRDGELIEYQAQFGDPGCGVLHPATPASIRLGAEDGGEMGAYHDEHHCRRRAAVLEKLQQYLALGLETTWVPDPRLLQRPPEISTTAHEG